MTAAAFRDRLRRRLEGQAGRTLLRVVGAGRAVEFTGAQLAEAACALADKWCSAPESEVVLLLLPHSPELFLLQLGLVLRGRIPAILPWPTTRVDPEKYQRNLLHQLRTLPATQIITHPGLASTLDRQLPYVATGCPVEGELPTKAVRPPEATTQDPPDVAPSSRRMPADTVFLQFSGGTTGSQKAVVVTSRMLEAQLDRLAAALDFTSQDGVVSWLPLYHDMGLIGCLWFPLWSGALSVQMAASDWLLEPDLLFKHVDASGATFCWLPNFAFSYLAAQRERMRGPFALGGMRAWINCSEPVRQKSMHAFADGFADWGVRRSQLQASYAMAESVFAVTQTPLGAVPTVVDRQSVVRSHTRYSPLAFDLIDDIFVSSGRPIDGMRVRVANAGVSSPAGECGEIQISSDCLFSGYWGADGYVTSAFTADGWYSTGDFGFLRGGELFVIGRTKDVVIIGGQNVFPEDVETIVNTVPGIYPGRVIAFGVGDEQMATESLVVIAEQRGPYDRDGAIALQRHIQQLVLATIGIAPRLAYVVPERWIVKSTAGKLSRRDTRERFLAERDRLARGAFVNAV